MRRAIELARAQHGRTGDNPSVGCVLMSADGRRLSEGATGDGGRPHAEQLALTQFDGKLPAGSVAYVTLEPCPLCATAIAFARLRKVVFGAYDPKGGGVEHGPRIFAQPTTHHVPEVIGGVMEMECSAILKAFFAERR